MCAQVREFCVSWIITTVPLMRFSSNAFFFKNQNARNAGNRCNHQDDQAWMNTQGHVKSRTHSQCSLYSVYWREVINMNVSWMWLTTAPYTHEMESGGKSMFVSVAGNCYHGVFILKLFTLNISTKNYGVEKSQGCNRG